MIDIHCHILPGIDDGAADMAEAVAMARLAQRSGVTGIVATPHFRGERQSLALVDRIIDRYQRFGQALQREGIRMELYPGAEVLCLPQTVELARKEELPTLSNSNCVLTEFFFDMPFEMMDEILSEIAQCGYRPVVAHPERYGAIIEDPRGLDYWFRRGYILQLNKGSVLGAFGYRVRNTAQWILETGLAHIVSSDAHSASHRTTDMSILRQFLLDEYPEPYVRVLMEENPQRLIRGLPMVDAL